MSMVADGQTVKLLLDGLSAQLFPSHLSSFNLVPMRVPMMTPNTTQDNLVIESEGGATFDPAVSVTEGRRISP